MKFFKSYQITQTGLFWALFSLFSFASCSYKMPQNLSLREADEVVWSDPNRTLEIVDSLKKVHLSLFQSNFCTCYNIFFTILEGIFFILKIMNQNSIISSKFFNSINNYAKKKQIIKYNSRIKIYLNMIKK